MPNILEMMRARGLNLDQFSGPPQPAPILNEVPNYPMRPDQIYNTLDNSPPDVGYMPPMDETMLQDIDVAPRGQGDSEIPIARVAPAIQEWLGAKEPTDNGIAGQMLSNRRSRADSIGQAAVETLMGGKPVSSQEVADRGLENELKTMNLLARIKSNSSGGGATLMAAEQLMDEAKSLGQPMTFAEAYSIAKSGVGVGYAYNPSQGAVGALPGYDPSRQGTKYAEGYGAQSGENQANIDLGGQVEVTKQDAQVLSDKKAKAPKAYSTMVATDATQQNTRKTIQEAKDLIAWNTTGAGSVLSGVWGTDARTLKGKIDTIKANIGFDKLQEMRVNSPTGGALGQVAVQELEYLQAVIAKLDQAANGPALNAALDDVDRAVQESNQRIKEAYMLDFGTIEGAPQLGGMGAPQGGEDPLGIR